MVESIEEIVIITEYPCDIDVDAEFYNPLPDYVPNVGNKKLGFLTKCYNNRN